MAILKVRSPGGRSKDAQNEGAKAQHEPDEQRRGLWYRTLPAYVVAAAIWMALLGLLYLYFVLRAPKELKGELSGKSDWVDCRSIAEILLRWEPSAKHPRW